MPEEKTEDQKAATDDAAKTSTDGAIDTQDKEPDLDTLLKDKRIQGEIDRRIASLQKTMELKAKEREAAAADKAKREFAEAKLLEDKKFQELAELKAKEATDALAKLERYEHEAKVAALLDKKGVTDPELRLLFMRFNGDLTELDPVIDKFHSQIEVQVEKRVNERLKTPPPPSKSEAKPKEDTSLDAQIAAAEKAGDYKESLRLKQIKSNQLNQIMRKAPASITEVIMPPMPGQQ